MAFAIIVGFSALVARIAVVRTAPDYELIADLQEYWTRAVYVFEHGSLFPSAWRMPGYPAALAFAFTFSSGPSLLAARVFNVLTGTATAFSLTGSLVARQALVPHW